MTNQETLTGRLLLLAFLCGAAVMSVELTGVRLLAPYLGTSLYVWTSLIVVILASLSAGYWWSGWFADRHPDPRFLAGVVLAASACLLMTATFESSLVQFFSRNFLDIRVAALAAALALFGPGSFLLGAVTPYSVRLSLRDISAGGKTVGRLYAISTLGSIMGTLLTGFYLLPALGSLQLLLLLAIVLALSAALPVHPSGPWALTIALLIACAAFIFLSRQIQQNSSHKDLDTRYSRVWIDEAIEVATQRRVRLLTTDPGGQQALIYLDNDQDLAYKVAHFFRLVDHFHTAPRRALTLGGAAFIQPRDFLRRHPEAEIDVVEIDSEITALARRYFGLKEDPRLHIFHQDGRSFLNQARKTYDAIFVDAFAGITIPFELVSQEAVQLEYRLLSQEGVLLLNVISAVQGEAGKLLQAIFATYRSVFPQVYLFPMQDFAAGDLIQNHILVALKSQQEPNWHTNDVMLQACLMQRWRGPDPAPIAVLTDQKAPVEYYAAQIIAQSRRDQLVNNF